MTNDNSENGMSLKEQLDLIHQFLSEGQNDEALETICALQVQNPSIDEDGSEQNHRLHAQLHNFEGVALAQSGQFDEALAAFEEERTLLEGPVLGPLADLDGARAQNAEFRTQVEALQSGPAEGGSSLGEVLDLIRSCLSEGQNDEALDAIRAVQAQIPSINEDGSEQNHRLHAQLHQWAAVALAQSGRFDEALAAYEQAEAILEGPVLGPLTNLDAARTQNAKLRAQVEALQSRSAKGGSSLDQVLDLIQDCLSERQNEKALDAIRTLQAQIPSIEEDGSQQNHRLHAQIHRWASVAHAHSGRFDEALEACEQAEAILEGPVLGPLADLDAARTRYAELRAKIEKDQARIRALGLSPDHAVLLHATERDVPGLLQQHHYEEALSRIATLQDVLPPAGPDALEEPALLHAKLAQWQGRALKALGRLAEAEDAFRRGLQVLARDRTGFAKLRAGLTADLADCLGQQRQLSQAETTFRTALDLYAGKTLAHRTELDDARAITRANLANCLSEQGDLKAAEAGYRKALELYAGETLAHRTELDDFRANTRMNLANCLSLQGDLKAAETEFRAALKLYAGETLAHRTELDDLRAKTRANLANCLHRQDDLKAAEAEYRKALDLYGGTTLALRTERDDDRAHARGNLANCLSDQGRLQEALEERALALELYRGPTLSKRPGLSGYVGLHLSNQAHDYLALFMATQDPEYLHKTAQHGDDAIDVRVRDIDHLPLPELERLARTCAGAAHLQSFRTAPNDWGRERSKLLVRMLDLAPPDRQARYWSGIREAFVTFHGRWLQQALSQVSEGGAAAAEGAAAVPQILSALQGRVLIAEVIEDATLEGEALSDAVRTKAVELRDLKREIREIYRAMDRALPGELASGGPGGSGTRGLRAIGMEGPAGRPEGRRDPEGRDLAAELAERRRDYDRKLQALLNEEGFEPLKAAFEPLSLEVLRRGLGRREALVVGFVTTPQADRFEAVLDHAPAPADPEARYDSHFWVLPPSGDPVVVTVPAGKASRDAKEPAPDVMAMATRLQRFDAGQAHSGRGLRQGGGGTAEALSADEMRGFWDRLDQDMARLVWTPLRDSGALQDVDRLVLATSGPLHNLTFAAGKARADCTPELIHSNALAFFAMGRQVMSDRPAKAQVPADPAPTIAIVSEEEDAGIPLARIEARVTKDIWDTQPVTDPGAGPRIHYSPNRFPWGHAPVTILRFCGHGHVDTGKLTPRVVLQLRTTGMEAPWQIITEQTLMRAPAAMDFELIACVGGQTFDDLLDGNPCGIVAGAMRAGARDILAFLVSVPDHVAAVAGILLALHRAESGARLPEAWAHCRAVMTGETEDTGLTTALRRHMAGPLAAFLAAQWAQWEILSGGTTMAATLNDNCPLIAPGIAADLEGIGPDADRLAARLQKEDVTFLPDRTRDPAGWGVVAFASQVYSMQPRPA